MNRSVVEIDDGIITRAASCLCCYCQTPAAEESPWACGPDLNLNEVQPETRLLKQGLRSAEVLIDLCCGDMISLQKKKYLYIFNFVMIIYKLFVLLWL